MYIKKNVVNLLKLYKKFVSPILLNLFGHGCRFTPTCSQYTIDAVNKKGVVVGLWKGFIRFLKCNPLSEPKYDPVT